MTDIFSKKKRSEIMSKIRSKGTKAEKTVFSFLRSKKISFKKHYLKIPGCPDVASLPERKAVFIGGDFWHGRDFKRAKKISAYWTKKIEGNMKRDKKQRAALKKMGWQVLIVWASDIERKSSVLKQLKKIETFLSSKKP